MKGFYKILDLFVKFVKSITNPEDDWQPHPDYPWFEINGNLEWRVNTKHPEWWKGIEKHLKINDKDTTDV